MRVDRNRTRLHGLVRGELVPWGVPILKVLIKIHEEICVRAATTRLFGTLRSFAERARLPNRIALDGHF